MRVLCVLAKLMALCAGGGSPSPWASVRLDSRGLVHVAPMTLVTPRRFMLGAGVFAGVFASGQVRASCSAVHVYLTLAYAWRLFVCFSPNIEHQSCEGAVSVTCHVWA